MYYYFYERAHTDAIPRLTSHIASSSHTVDRYIETTQKQSRFTSPARGRLASLGNESGTVSTRFIIAQRISETALSFAMPKLLLWTFVSSTATTRRSTVEFPKEIPRNEKRQHRKWERPHATILRHLYRNKSFYFIPLLSSFNHHRSESVELEAARGGGA